MPHRFETTPKNWGDSVTVAIVADRTPSVGNGSWMNSNPSIRVFFTSNFTLPSSGFLLGSKNTLFLYGLTEHRRRFWAIDEFHVAIFFAIYRAVIVAQCDWNKKRSGTDLFRSEGDSEWKMWVKNFLQLLNKIRAHSREPDYFTWNFWACHDRKISFTKCNANKADT